MVFVLLALWGTSLTLILLNKEKVSVRWLSAVSFCGGSGALAAVIGETILPLLTVDFAMMRTLVSIQIGASIVSYYGLPYTFLMFAIYYQGDLFSQRWRRLLSVILLLPIVYMFIFTPVYTVAYPELYKTLSFWVIPYIIVGTFLCLLRKETQPQLRLNHFFTCLAVLTPVLYCSVMNYLLPAFGFYEMWRYNTWMIVFAVIVFVFATFTYGFMGVRLFIERRQLTHTLRAITSGTAMLNHAIKNDVGKMKLFGEKVRRYAKATEQDELMQDIDVIMTSALHIQEMIARVQDQTQEIELKLERFSLNELLMNVINTYHIYEPKIKINCKLEDNLELVCDQTQLREVIHNLVQNAIEAMPDGGTINCTAITQKKHVVITIQDTGTGINKNFIKKVMDPFFTTKSEGMLNFGLGLPYCYNVIKKHGGLLKLESETDEGTTAILKFPIKG